MISVRLLASSGVKIVGVEVAGRRAVQQRTEEERAEEDADRRVAAEEGDRDPDERDLGGDLHARQVDTEQPAEQVDPPASPANAPEIAIARK